MEEDLKYHTKHITALDGLRGYAAIIVTFYHSILHMQPTLIERVLSPAMDKIDRADILAKIALTLLNGSAAVLLFYVLSGAVLCIEWSCIMPIIIERSIYSAFTSTVYNKTHF